MAIKKNNNNSKLFKVVNYERVEAGFGSIKQLAEQIERQPQGFASTLKAGSTKFCDVVKLCDEMKLQLIIRNKETNTDHILNKKGEYATKKL